MATKTFEELKQMAIQIRDEKTNKQNTATRIGTQMLEHLNKLEQEYYDKITLDKRVTELNISELYKTQGIGGTNKYDLATAIAQVPTQYRSIQGLKVTFINNDTSKSETWVYDGGTFTTITNWKLSNDSEKLNAVEKDLFHKPTMENSPLSANLLDIEGVNWVGGGLINYNGTGITPNADYAYSEDYQEISHLAGKTIYGNIFQLTIYDFNKDFIENISSPSSGKTLPENAFYWRVSTWSSKTTSEEIKSDLLAKKNYVALSKLGSNADVYQGRKIITEKDFQLTSEQMPSDYVPTIGNGTITKEKLEASILEEIDYKLNKSIGKNLCMHEECLLNQYMNDQGKIISADGYALTGLIPIRNGQILRCNQQYIVSYNGLYDKNRQIIKSSLVQASGQQYLVGTEESAFAQFSFGVDKLSTLMVEEVDSIEDVSSEYEPYTDKNKILNVLGFNEEINHPMLTKQFSFFNKTWMTFCDSFGITGTTMGGKTNTLYVRDKTYGYNKTHQGYTWHRYISDYLQLGGLINNAVGGSCVSNAYALISPFCTRVDSIESDESVAIALLEAGTNDWYYNVPM